MECGGSTPLSTARLDASPDPIVATLIHRRAVKPPHSTPIQKIAGW